MRRTSISAFFFFLPGTFSLHRPLFARTQRGERPVRLTIISAPAAFWRRTALVRFGEPRVFPAAARRAAEMRLFLAPTKRKLEVSNAKTGCSKGLCVVLVFALKKRPWERLANLFPSAIFANADTKSGGNGRRMALLIDRPDLRRRFCLESTKSRQSNNNITRLPARA